MKKPQSEYIAVDGDRLDSIVYKYYGTLEPLERVIALNVQLPAILRTGDRVILPEFTPEPKEARLW